MVEAGSEEEVSFRKYRTPEVNSGQSPPLPLRTYPEPMSWPEKGEGRRWKRKQCYRAGHTNNQNGSRLLYRFSQSCTKFDFKISSKKTKSLTFSKKLLRCNVQISNTIIEPVTFFNYFGVQITSSKDLNTEVRHQAIKS